MKLIKKIRYNKNPTEIRFDNYELDASTFLFYNNRKNYWGWDNKYNYNKDWLKDKAKEDYPMYVILNQQNRVIDMIPVKLPAYLVDFYKQNQNDYENYALAVEKFGHFYKDRLEYMHPNGKELFYKPKGNFSFIINKIKTKQDAIKSGLEKTGKKVECQKLKQTWRMATGLGNASAYNNGFTFHPVFGIPYIGGQQLKGIVRAYLIRKHFYIEKIEGKKTNGKDIDKYAMKDELFAYLFGREKVSKEQTERKGNLHFLDAFPLNHDFKMKADIMNPHYGDYYSDKKAPGDYLSPNPIFFLCIVNASFNFYFWVDEKKDLTGKNFSNKKLDIEDDETISSYIKRILPEALEILGIGAKTALGYGRFE